MLKLLVQQRSEDDLSGIMAPFIDILWSIFPQKPPPEDCSHPITETLRSPSLAASSMAAAGFTAKREPVKMYPTDVSMSYTSAWFVHHPAHVALIWLSWRQSLGTRADYCLVWMETDTFACSLQTSVNYFTSGFQTERDILFCCQTDFYMLHSTPLLKNVTCIHHYRCVISIWSQHMWIVVI